MWSWGRRRIRRRSKSAGKPADKQGNKWCWSYERSIRPRKCGGGGLTAHLFREGTQIGDITHKGFFLNKVRFDIAGRTYDVRRRRVLGGPIFLQDGPEVLATANHHGWVVLRSDELNDYHDLVVAGQQYTLRCLAPRRDWTSSYGSAGIRDRLVLSRRGSEVGRIRWGVPVAPPLNLASDSESSRGIVGGDEHQTSVFVDIQDDLPLPVVAFVGWLGHSQALEMEAALGD